ncbi:zinc finger, CCHC-type containing protein [Tanacetum coccineum]
MATVMKHMVANFSKLNKFEGVDFRRWQKKMHFLLSTMSVVYVLNTPIPDDGDDGTVEQIKRRNKWENDDYVCRSIILNDFKHTLKHKKEELTLIELGSHLRIKESLRVQDSDKPKGNNVVVSSVVNIMEHNNSIRYNDNKGKRKHHDTKADPNKKSKVTCWKMMVLRDRCWFKTYESLNDGNILHMINESTALVHGHGCVDLRFSFGKIVFLFNVLHVPNIRKNLVSSSHVHFKRMQDMYKDGLILDFDKNIERFVRLPDPKLETLGEKGIECIFVGYAEHFKAFRFSSVPRQSHRSLINGTEGIGGLIVSKEVTEEKEGINDEIDSIMANNTWVLADLPLGCKPLGCKWIFKRKLNVDVTIENTIRLMIALASIHNMIIHQMDVKTTFLNGELDEEAPKHWHQKFNKVVLSNGYLLNQDQVQVDLTKEFLSSRFSMKDMGKADVIIGIRIKHDNTSEKLMHNNDKAISQLEYSRVIGCLMYAMTCIRLDIAFAMGKLSRYTSNPSTHRWQTIQRVLKYLKKTMDYSLSYIGYPSVLKGYTDASWISNTEDNLSTSGWVFLLGGGAISWASKKQTCITSSTMESELVALAAASKEAEWLRNLILEIPLWSKPIAPIFICCDSAATLAKAYSQMYNEKSRHLGVRNSMIRALIMNGVVSIKFVRSQQNLADHLTKELARDLVIKSAEGMGLKSNLVAEC